MRKKLFLHSSIIWLFIIGIGYLQSGCTATLAPPYNESLVEDLNNNLTSTLNYFNSVTDDGLNPSNPVHMKMLNDQISIYEAMEIRASARAIPEGAALDKMNRWLEKRGLQAIGDEIPSAVALGEIKETLKKIKTTIQNNGATATEMMAFKNQILIYYDQALTYENHLKR